MEISPIPAFRDNYIWLLRQGRDAAVVDPGDAAPVLDYLGRHSLNLCAILVTHHHADHVGGVAELAQRFRVPVFGPAQEHIAAVGLPLGEGDHVSLPQIGAEFVVLEVPGHTRGHIAYYGANALFCGDTLFACGCGRLFEGTPDEMFNSLGRLAALPTTTQVYCAHEYTQANCSFALAVEPDNRELRERSREVAGRRKAGLPTVPSTIGVERATNPFLRHASSAVRAAAEHYRGAHIDDDVGVFAAIREWKNSF